MPNDAYLAGGENPTLPAPLGVRLNNLGTTAAGFDNLSIDVPEPSLAVFSLAIVATELTGGRTRERHGRAAYRFSQTS